MSAAVFQPIRFSKERLRQRGYSVVLPEIIDYEVRRELLRVNRVNSIRRLDLLKSEIIYLPITTEVMLKAAQMWAQVRQQGKPTADNRASRRRCDFSRSSHPDWER